MIDAHLHLDRRFGGGWIDRPVADLVDLLDEVGAEFVVDLSGGWGTDVLEAHLDHFKASHPDRFVHLGGLAWERWPDQGNRFGDDAARSLAAQIDRGAGGLKVWKTIGLVATDASGSVVDLDDPRLDPVWALLVDRGLPAVIHVGDPPAYFGPIAEAGAKRDELVAHPEWHWHERSDRHPSDLLASFERLLDRWPALSVVGAHLLDLGGGPALLERVLAQHPNLAVDLGARSHELQGEELRSVLARRSDQVLFGLDHPPSVEQYGRSIGDIVIALQEGFRREQLLGEADDRLAGVLAGNARRRFRP